MNVQLLWALVRPHVPAPDYDSWGTVYNGWGGGRAYGSSCGVGYDHGDGLEGGYGNWEGDGFGEGSWYGSGSGAVQGNDR